MATDRNHIRELVDKLEALPPERIAEVEDFIDFLNSRDPDRRLTQAARRMAEPSLAQVWDNPDDAVYDEL
ncbi:MAG TPA: toxin-antitoxin system, antitoxin component, Xre family protein [Anaerolineae bacterium]|nr:toxin-antitoxin system, antitoxin component, Xre family protein [Anaerolineae bacterium]